MEPGRVDAAVDIAYGAVIFVAVVLMVVVGGQIGIAFGLGVLISYGIHVVWKMARFDPEWMTQEVEETIEAAVERQVDESVGNTVERSVADAVDETVGDAVEDAVEETISEKAAENNGEGTDALEE
jgi:hypothetical protein